MDNLTEETMGNDENQPPQSPQLVNLDMLTCVGTLLKESQRNNIDLSSTIIVKNSSAQSPASSSFNVPVSPTGQENTNTNPQCLIEEEKCKDETSLHFTENHDENVKVASEVISKLVESLPLQIEDKSEISHISRLESPIQNLSIEKHDSHSICSTDYTPSDSSFDTAREELQQSIPDTEYESANDFDESSIIIAASTPREENAIPSSFFLKNLQTVIPNRNKDFVEREKTPLVPPEIDSFFEESTDDIKEDSIVPFDRESTPIISNEILCAAESPVEFLTVDSNDNICVASDSGLENLINSNNNVDNICTFSQTETHLISSNDETVSIVSSTVSDKNSSEELEVRETTLNISFENLSVRNRLNSDPCSEISVETVIDKGIGLQIESFEADIQTENLKESSEVEEVKNRESSLVEIVDDTVENEEVGLTEFINFEEKIDLEAAADAAAAATVASIKTQIECTELIHTEENNNITRDQELSGELISAEENNSNKNITQDPEEKVESISAAESSENNIKEEESQRLDTTFGTVYWQSNYTNCQSPSNKLIVTQEDTVDGIVNQEETKEVDLEERLKLEAAIVAEELINSSLRENDFDQEIEFERSETDNKSMKDNKMADMENNEPSHDDSSVDSGGKMDENVNPFQSKSKVGNSPVRRGSAKMKNGEVSTPTKMNVSTHDSPLKKSSSAPKPTSTTRIGSVASPKRKGSETTPTHSEAVPIAKDQVDSHNSGDVDLDGFKKPAAKQIISARTSTSKVSPNETEAGDTGLMVRSVEDNMTSEAGPDVAEFSDSEFRSAAEAFKDPAAFDFLQMAGSKHLSESALARMSLYVKFDPLLKAISPVAKRTLSKTSTSDQSQMSTNSDGSDDLLLLGTPTNKENSDKPQESNGTLANKNACVEGRLLDFSPSPLKHHLKASECNSPQNNCRVYSEEEFIQALRMQELLFQEQLLKKDREADERAKSIDKELNEGANRLLILQKNCDEMKKTVLEYEKTISQLIDDREREKHVTEENISALSKERDQSLEDLQGVEKAFGDLHRRFEKSKAAVEGFKKNEEILTNCVKESQIALRKQEQKYELLKHHAEETLTCANQEIDALRRSSEVEIAALRAQLKKAEMKVESLEKSLQQMHKENSELTNICDELIAKVGQSNA